MRINMTALALASSVGLVSPDAFAAGIGSSTNVTLYGIVDAGFVHESGGAKGTLNKITSGANSMSRYGFRGSEDLGGGLSAIFGLESGIKIDTGEVDATGTVFNRFAFVGLKSTTYGTLTLGRQYTPWYTTLFTMADPFGTSLEGNLKSLFPVSGSAARMKNSVLYVSPSVRGASVEFGYGLGEQAGSASAGRQLGFAAVYQSGPLHLRFAYANRNNDVATGTAPVVKHGAATNKLMAGNYDFGFLKAYLAYDIDQGEGSGTLPNANAYGTVPAPTPSTDARNMVIGFTARLGPGKFIASHVRKDDRTRFNQDAAQWGVGYQYPLSVRTLLYTSYAWMDNKNGAGYTVGNGGEVGSGNRGFSLGVRHTF
jgi:predicted porin